ncbi:YpiF family protein [Oceanobacillus manasiensis]|uniref:YpiF family protein n=1 Tax=Oceanobacillus manasiensis TaxID=586413 RepID=UPI0005AB6123|nr:YpiF family protein [Oceanobacillus manasiensis]
MKWKKNDIAQYIEAKEYIDSVLIPLVPFQVSDENALTTSTFQSEVIYILANEIEKELTGRVLLTPTYHYLKNSNKETEVDRLNYWVQDVKQQPFEHVFFITFDSGWKKLEKELDGTLLWLPGSKTGNLQSVEMRALIKEQVEQLGELIRSYWV